jgi:hypothetical protein
MTQTIPKPLHRILNMKFHSTYICKVITQIVGNGFRELKYSFKDQSTGLKATALFLGTESRVGEGHKGDRRYG